MSKQIIHQSIPFTGTAGAPTGNAAGSVVLSTSMPEYTARDVKWLLTVTVTGGAATITLWGALGAGVGADSTDDVWGTVQDKYGTYPSGVIKTTMAVGTQHFIVEDLGIYTRLYVQISANAATGFFSPIMETKVP